MARLFAKFPSHQIALDLALQALSHCVPSLPKQDPAHPDGDPDERAGGPV